MVTSECASSVVGHFDGHAEALKRYGAYRLMQHVQAYSGIPERWHWATTCSVLPRRPTGQQSSNQRCKMYPLCWPFRWPWLRLYYTACITRWSRFMAFQKATNAAIMQALAPIASIGHAFPWFWGYMLYFIVNLLKKGLSCPNNKRGITHQSDEKHLSKTSGYLVGGLVYNCI